MPYFERQPTLPSVFKEQHYRLNALERIASEQAVQSHVFTPNAYPEWFNQAYASGARVVYNGASYSASSATAATDIPGVSSKWTAISGASLNDTRSRGDDGLLLNNISAMTGKTAQLLSTTVSTGPAGLIETYVRMNADASGSGNSMVLRISIDGVSQGSYMSWANVGLTDRKTITGSTIGTTTVAGGFVVVDDAAPNKGWDDSTSTEIDTIYTGLVLDEGVHTLTYELICTGTGSFGSVYKAVVAIRTT